MNLTSIFTFLQKVRKNALFKQTIFPKTLVYLDELLRNVFAHNYKRFWV